MRSDIRTLIRDIQAAARIGHVESLWAALEDLQDLPQIAGNHPMDETFLIQVILPAGAAMGRARVKYSVLKPLITHSVAAYRAAAGVALAEQYLHGLNGTNLKSLNALVQDPRPDVREAIRLAVNQSSDPDPAKLSDLFQTWQQSSSPRVQALAYQILANLPPDIVLDKLDSVETQAIASRPEVKKTISGTLSTLAANGHARKVLEILSRWAALEELDHRLIAGCLSKPWAAAYPDDSLHILTQLAARFGAQKRIRKALQSLYRHGAEDHVRTALAQWRDAEDPNLREAGSDEKLNL